MKWSHSKLNLAMTCPMSWYLNYVQGIQPKKEKNAFSIGSAVHWGLEHNTSDLTDYWNENFKTRGNYTTEQLLAEAMVAGYLKNKDILFQEILKDPDDETKQLEVIDESHELEIYSKLKSYKFKEDHDFMGIIDLLLLTNKGWILLDYKTSSQKPDWNKYLDQIYRYIYLLNNAFPDIPVCKIGIINILKSQMRQKKNENEESFKQRLTIEYETNDEDYVNVHMYLPSELDKKVIDMYFENLSKMADTAQTLIENKMFFVNYNNAITVYGNSDYYDIFYKTPDCYLLYKIKDKVWNPITNTFDKERDCNKTDLLTIEDMYLCKDKIINHYEDFKKAINENKDLDKYIIDSSLIDLYYLTYEKELELENNKN